MTSALTNLRGLFFTDYNLWAAGSVLVALPPVLVFMLLRRQFTAGPTLGASKGRPPSSGVPKPPVCADGRVCAFADADDPGNS